MNFFSNLFNKAKTNRGMLFTLVMLLHVAAIVSCVRIPINQNDTDEDSQAGAMPLAWETVSYGDDTVVVVNTAADVYESADRTSRRITQLLFNQPVQVTAQNDLWAKVNIEENNAGWVRARDLDSDWTCVDPRRYSGRVVVTSKEKQVYSQPRDGIVIRDVTMGTELFFYTRSDNVYEVALPGNLTGWISESGTFQLEVDEPIKKTTAEVFVQSCEKFLGTGYLLGGIGSMGIDSAGIIHVAMKINGVVVPRDFSGQYRKGRAVEFGSIDNINESALSIGDVFFFGPNVEYEEGGFQNIDDAGIYMGNGEFLHASQHTGRVQLNNISDDYYKQRLRGIRRYF